MRFRTLAIGCALGALLLMPAAPAQGATKCTARKAQTELQTRTARLFTTPLGNAERRVYGCLYSRNRNYLIGIERDCDPGATVSKYVLAGRYVGYVQTNCNIDQSDDYVVVKDLTTGSDKYHVIAATGQESTFPPSTLVRDLALSRTGSVAWIGDWDAHSGSSTPDPNDDRQVRKMEPGSPEGGTLLDSGLSIDKRSLGLSARTSGGYSWLYWTKGDSPFAAKLN